ncbi:hypothetical protein [Psychrobacillus lasiicapitis]|uniref:GNAT family N-acetyltransferase n=1 Tax=Psychrobacillus lasiicapitis TaxID=1636719 RepID=A0A544SZY8_9BACI|nr:hypothetical protein [Psychrobacillus lasiicapitis]TQR10773.1 hypothetical protein FG382_17090 [Psychrobacillus lasiicapitis]GGA42575.1 hypothetical protein GCM10011384_35400 [Psychrobacillus lasiicapitis]
MELVLIKSYKHLSIYEQDWCAILEENKNRNPFIEYDFVYNWWKLIGENEGVEIYAVKEHNRMIAFFPFQLKKALFGYIVQFLAYKDAYYMDLIALKRDLNRVIMFVFDAIIDQKKSAVFHLHGLVESSGTPAKITNYLQARNMKEQYTRAVTESNDYTRKTIFSTNTIRAKTYRNFLWSKEAVNARSVNRKT